MEDVVVENLGEAAPLSLADLENMVQHSTLPGHPPPEQFRQCLQTPRALAASFRRGGTGPPDFAAVCAASTAMTVHSGGVWHSSAADPVAAGSVPSASRRSRAIIHASASALMEALSLAMQCESYSGGSTSSRAVPDNDASTHQGDDSVQLALAMAGSEAAHRSTELGVEDAGGDVAMSDLAPDSEAAQALPTFEVQDEAVDPIWVLVALAAALPMLEDALPKDARGECVMPHQHSMDMVDAEAAGMRLHLLGARVLYITNRVCDRCTAHITERFHYHCPHQRCDLDFCEPCHHELQAVLDGFFTLPPETYMAPGAEPTQQDMMDRMLWVVHFTDEVAAQVLHRGPVERMALAELLALEWPVELFERLVKVVVDVCNGKMVFNCSSGSMTTSVSRAVAGQGEGRYVQQLNPIYQDERFWCSLGLLEFLYACNSLPRERVLDGHAERGPRIPVDSFLLAGINHCRPEVEWEHWMRFTRDGPPVPLDILRAETVSTQGSFRSLLSHSHLLPISFRRKCVVIDVQTNRALRHRSYHSVEVERDPERLVEALSTAFQPQAADNEATDDADPEESTEQRLLAPLRVKFAGECGQGPGVHREFFQVALRAFLAVLFLPTGERTYWFRDTQNPRAFFACGVLLARAVTDDVLIPNFFPWTLFDLLLRELGSPHASKQLGLPHVAAASPEEANSLQRVLDYEGSDIADVFGDAGWERTGSLNGQHLNQDTKKDFVSRYIQWCLVDRIASQFGPLSAGFCAVLGKSPMIRWMVDARQLERMICGGDVPVDVVALRRFAVQEGWTAEDKDYLDGFWSCLERLSEADKLRFLVFLTSSDRVPLRGWEELRLAIQRNGSGDDRLPSAYTCFKLLLLPKYSTLEVLEQRLLQAITNAEGFGLN